MSNLSDNPYITTFDQKICLPFPPKNENLEIVCSFGIHYSEILRMKEAKLTLHMHEDYE